MPGGSALNGASGEANGYRRNTRLGRAERCLAACCAVALALATASAPAAEKRNVKKKAASRVTVEKLTCMLGSEDRHARIAVEVKDGRIESFAYYSKWKPRTCSVHVERDDSYSKWEDAGRFTAVITEKGAFLIENRPEDVHFLFRNVERMFYCGMEGKITGTLTVVRGANECVLEGVMDEDPDKDPTPGTTAAAPS
jgi:hypothetical protein